MRGFLSVGISGSAKPTISARTTRAGGIKFITVHV